MPSNVYELVKSVSRHTFHHQLRKIVYAVGNGPEALPTLRLQMDSSQGESSQVPQVPESIMEIIEAETCPYSKSC
jgi:hypothetical protein